MAIAHVGGGTGFCVAVSLRQIGPRDQPGAVLHQTRPHDAQDGPGARRFLVKIRDEGAVPNEALNVALRVMADGTRMVPGMSSEQDEAPSSCHRLINKLKSRGAEDILQAVVDGLKGCLETITAVFPETIVPTCIAHPRGNSMDFVSWKDRKAVAAKSRNTPNCIG